MGCWKVFDLPQPEVVYATIVDWYNQYGLMVVAFAALVEGVVLVGLYFPGSAVILIGVASSRGDPLRAVAVVACVNAAFIVAAFWNFAIGYFGMHAVIERLGGEQWLNRARQRYERYGALILAPCFVHPNLGGFMSVAAGIGRLALGRFAVICVVSIVLWNSAWGFVAYFLAGVVEQVATQPWLVVGGLSIWVFVAFVWGAVRREPKADGSL